MIHLYDKDTIDTMPWPDTEESRYVKECLTPFVKENIKSFFQNVDTEFYLLNVNGKIMPITINENEFENSYICSLYAQYVLCALEKINTISKTFIKKPLSALVKGLGILLKKGKINATVQINNWLFSTNLYPDLTLDDIELIKNFFKTKYPKKTILFRSLVPDINCDLILGLKKSGFKFIASRPVYILNTKEKEPFQSRMFKSDLKVLKESRYKVEAPTQEHSARLVELYSKLYLDKYSLYNPQLTEKFVSHAINNKLLNFKVLRKEGDIDAVVGYCENNHVITSPFFGYDTALPQNLGLYRQIATLLSLEAQSKQKWLHKSSGAGSYKKLRRAKFSIEYMAVCTDHLPLKRRCVWIVLEKIINTIGIPFMKRFHF